MQFSAFVEMLLQKNSDHDDDDYCEDHVDNDYYNDYGEDNDDDDYCEDYDDNHENNDKDNGEDTDIKHFSSSSSRVGEFLEGVRS